MSVSAARRYIVRGRVQGVGFRSFVQRIASGLKLHGYTRNLDDGSVEIYAVGPPRQLDEFAGHLWKGPGFADVRTVDQEEASVESVSGFRITW
ncbi:MAG: acylphosphatase [Acidobacteria bacterium]|nr:acylphosphatase [Acidobacteriota bacterium]